jgi:hypothetical protein
MKNNSTKKLIAGIVLSVVLIAALIVALIIVSRPAHVLHHHIPANASVYLKVNNPNLLRRFFFDFLFKADLEKKDYEQIDYRRKVKDVPISGIDISKEVFMFYENWGNHNIVGLLFHLNDVNDFSEFITTTEQTVYAFNDQLAVTLLYPEDFSEENIGKLELYAKDLLNKSPDKTAARIAFSEGSVDNLFQVYMKGDDRHLIRNMNLELFMNGNTIEVEGIGEKNPVKTTDSTSSYFYMSDRHTDRDFLEINSGQLPDTVNQYIHAILEEVGIDFPDISSQQLFIYAFEIDNIRGSMAVLPKFDGIFRFNEPIPNIVDMDTLNSKMMRLKDSSLKVGKVNYTIIQLNDHEIFIGVNDVEFKEESKAPQLLIQGNPGVILNIEGDGLIAQMAKLMPQVQHSKKFFNDMESFRIESQEYHSDSVRVNGEIQFADDKTASIEIIKFLLKF